MEIPKLIELQNTSTLVLKYATELSQLIDTLRDVSMHDDKEPSDREKISSRERYYQDRINKVISKLKKYTDTLDDLSLTAQSEDRPHHRDTSYDYDSLKELARLSGEVPGEVPIQEERL